MWPLAAAGVLLTGLLAGCSGTADQSGSPEDTASPNPAAPSSSTAPTCSEPCYGSVVNVGTLSSEVVVEVSGMAASQRTAGVYYVVSDEAGTSEVVAVREDGSPVARIEVEGMRAENAEALAVGPCSERSTESCLYVGDIGDHVGREDVVVYRISEPDLSTPNVRVSADELRFTYPDGPTDAEALLVDESGHPLIITKADFDKQTGVSAETRLYRGGTEGGVLELVAEFELPEPQSASFAGLVGNVVTDAAGADGRVLLRTYDAVIEYVAPEPGSELAGFPSWPHEEVPAPPQLQSETVTFRQGQCGYLTTSEPTGAIDAVTCVAE